MQNRLFTPKSEPKKCLISEADQCVLREYIEGMTDNLNGMLDQEKEIISSVSDTIARAKALRTKLKALVWPEEKLPPASEDFKQQLISEEAENLKLCITAHTQRIETLKKILNGEPIAQSEQAHLLKMELFKNTIVSRYSNVIDEKDNAVTQTTSPSPVNG
jgi:hypothetical protein